MREDTHPTQQKRRPPPQLTHTHTPGNRLHKTATPASFHSISNLVMLTNTPPHQMLCIDAVNPPEAKHKSPRLPPGECLTLAQFSLFPSMFFIPRCACNRGATNPDA